MSPEEGKEVIIEYNKIKAERDHYKAENEALKKEVECLNSVIKGRKD